MHYIAALEETGDMPCASCEALWSIPLLAGYLKEKRLRSQGFAYLAFDDGAFCINHCPHCEQEVQRVEVAPWLTLHPSL